MGEDVKFVDCVAVDHEAALVTVTIRENGVSAKASFDKDQLTAFREALSVQSTAAKAWAPSLLVEYTLLRPPGDEPEEAIDDA